MLSVLLHSSVVIDGLWYRKKKSNKHSNRIRFVKFMEKVKI